MFNLICYETLKVTKASYPYKAVRTGKTVSKECLRDNIRSHNPQQYGHESLYSSFIIYFVHACMCHIDIIAI